MQNKVCAIFFSDGFRESAFNGYEQPGHQLSPKSHSSGGGLKEGITQHAVLGGIYKENTVCVEKTLPKVHSSAPWYNQKIGCTKAVTLECHS